MCFSAALTLACFTFIAGDRISLLVLLQSLNELCQRNEGAVTLLGPFQHIGEQGREGDDCPKGDIYLAQLLK